MHARTLMQIKAMKAIAIMDVELSVDERNTLSAAYKLAVGQSHVMRHLSRHP